MRVPVYCPNCGSLFPSELFGDVSTFSTIKSTGNTEQCPNCGFPGGIVSEGVFRITEDAIEIISAPDLTVAMLNAFSSLAKRAANGTISEAKAVEEANSISPRLGAFLAKAFSKTPYALPIIIALIGVYLQIRANNAADVSTEQILSALSQQTHVLQQINDNLQKPRTTPPNAKPVTKIEPKVTAKSVRKSSRRAEVNHARRGTILRRRTEFGGARTH